MFIDNADTRELLWGLPEVVGTVQQVHLCPVNKSAHTKKIWKLIEGTSYIYIYIPQDKNMK